MKRLSLCALGPLAWLAFVLSGPAALGDPVSALQRLRVSGCAGTLPALQPLQHNAELDKAAALWSAGGSPLIAAEHSGYQTTSAVGMRLRGPDDAVMQALRKTGCRDFALGSLHDFGSYRKGEQYWVVMAATPVTHTDASQVGALVDSAQTLKIAERVLVRVNAARARGARCGSHTFGVAPSLRLSARLGDAASRHAVDMARNDYFEHVDLSGHSPLERVRAAGYQERLVGENIAYGPASADEAVAGWLRSPDHCENLMDPRFAEMGLAYAPGQGRRRGLYWDQVLAAPAK